MKAFSIFNIRSLGKIPPYSKKISIWVKLHVNLTFALCIVLCTIYTCNTSASMAIASGVHAKNKDHHHQGFHSLMTEKPPPWIDPVDDVFQGVCHTRHVWHCGLARYFLSGFLSLAFS